MLVTSSESRNSESGKALEGEAVLPSVGRLEGICVPDLMWDHCHRKRTGSLRVRRLGVCRSVFFDRGRIVFATSDDPNERLGELLVREGLITLEQYEQAAAQLDTGKRLGSALVDAGHLTQENLVRSVLAQVRCIILGIFSWEEGEYFFDEGPLQGEDWIQLGVHTGELIFEGIRRIRSFTVLRRGVGSPRVRYRLSADARERLQGVTLQDGESLLLDRLEGTERSVDGLCQELFLSNFEIYQALLAFKVLGVVEKSGPAEGGEASRDGGRLDQTEFLAVLMRLCREGETGILHASRGLVDRTFHIREGRCVFATSTSADDSLVAHLLRRGVISVRDREDVSRRLLTNKRAGTLLLEMGVIDESDLQRMVREQLSEIVYDTARWPEGEWAFAPGELPTIEGIIIDRSLEDLVFHAVRQVVDWSRILKGIGGLDAWLTVTPRYLEILDRTSIGADEWEIVACLGGPRPVREVCQAHRMGDFRICQMLWALKLLGAISEVPAPAVQASDTGAATTSTAEPEATATPPLEAEPAIPAPAVEASAGQTQPFGMIGSVSPPEAEALEALPTREWPTLETRPRMETPQNLETPKPDSVVPRIAYPAQPETSHESAQEEERAEVPAEEDAPPQSPRFQVAGAPVASSEEGPLDPELERQIDKFNACQRVVYRAIRSEIGAGAANFIRFCGGKLTDGFNQLFDPVDLMDDGAWDVEGLRKSVGRGGVLDPWLGFQRLLDKEVEMVYLHLGPARAETLQKRIEEFERGPGSPST